jgi:hypothetical protein
MFLIKRSFGLFVVIMIFTICISSQNTSKKPSNPIDFKRGEVEEWVAWYSTSMFGEMNPRETLSKAIYFGKLNKEESESAPREWLKSPKKVVPKGYLNRYILLTFERHFYEFICLMGTIELSDDFSEVVFDDHEYSLVKNSDYVNILTASLVKNGISKESYVSFFRRDGKMVTKKQVISIEKALLDVSNSVKSRINPLLYDNNLKKFTKHWEIKGDTKSNYRLILNRLPLGGAFIIGKKKGRIQILDFPTAID